MNKIILYTPDYETAKAIMANYHFNGRENPLASTTRPSTVKKDQWYCDMVTERNNRLYVLSSDYLQNGSKDWLEANEDNDETDREVINHLRGVSCQ